MSLGKLRLDGQMIPLSLAIFSSSYHVLFWHFAPIYLHKLESIGMYFLKRLVFIVMF